MTGAPRPRLVATDLDGTLLRADGTVSERTRAVLLELDRQGVPVVFTTGRPIRWMETLWSDVGGHGLAILSNGGIVYDVATHTVRRARTIDPATALEVAERVRADVPGAVFALEKTGGFGVDETWPERKEAAGVPRGPLAEILDDTVVKMLALHLEAAPEAFWRSVESVAGELVTTTWSSSMPLVEMSARGVTKASTLEDLCHELGIASDEVVAFGDMPNDVPLLTWAGTSYAMANGHETAAAAATHRAPHHDEDGVAQVLEELFDL